MSTFDHIQTYEELNALFPRRCACGATPETTSISSRFALDRQTFYACDACHVQREGATVRALGLEPAAMFPAAPEPCGVCGEHTKNSYFVRALAASVRVCFDCEYRCIRDACIPTTIAGLIPAPPAALHKRVGQIVLRQAMARQALAESARMGEGETTP
ncbi:hypothetical protein [Deinococcus sp. QL22]|uniref:hypothetical protein n=1 Tax=Deinococcus sp. QL22 TaxID=2939437 RepID=UPI00201757DF|nr:hypothetical protein [Deinococcus sp. QL22]UQN10315.1 hypothetical protein M1R55_29630 [Deinococcus sp. QL22]UQN10449.1 hypothetical protein M1R55_28955 [Deinococcus sp. QL22]